MTLQLSGLLQHIKEVRLFKTIIVVVGLANSGKTAIIDSLRSTIAGCIKTSARTGPQVYFIHNITFV